MIQAGDSTGFREVLVGILRLPESFCGGNLDGNLPLQFLIVSQVDPTKRTFTKDSFQSIPTKLSVTHGLFADVGLSRIETILLTFVA